MVVVRDGLIVVLVTCCCFVVGFVTILTIFVLRVVVRSVVVLLTVVLEGAFVISKLPLGLKLFGDLFLL